MPDSQTLSRASAITSSSCSRLMAVKTGLTSFKLGAGVVLCAATQIEQEEDSVLFAWLCVDSATAVHNIRDKHSHTTHREQAFMRSCMGPSSFRLYRLLCAKQSRAE
jgi:hypothetical protein